MRTLVVYFSRSDTTRTLAQQIARGCAADIEAIQALRSRSGAMGYACSLLEAVTQREAAIAPSDHIPGSYELVVLGTPVWAWSISSPVRAYIQRHQGQFRKLAFFCTYGGAGQSQVLAQMQQLCAKAPMATLALRTQEVQDNVFQERLDGFVKQLQASEPASRGTGPLPA